MAPKWYESAKLIDSVIDDQPVQMLSHKAVVEKETEEILLKAIVPVEYAHLGFGCNTLSGEVIGPALIAEEALIDPGIIQGQETSFYLDLIKNRYELNEKMGVSASASYSGLFKASAKTTFVNEHKFNRESVYLIARVLVTNSRTQLIEYKPSDSFAEFIANDPTKIKWNRFLEIYGNQFIFSIATGGEFYALYEFHTESIQQKYALETHLKGKGWGFQAEGDFKKELEKIDTNVNITCKLYIRGGRGKLPEIKDDKIIDAALSFPQSVDPEAGAPVVYQAVTKDYKVVADFPGFPDDINENLDSNEKICDEVAKQLARIEDLEQSLVMQGDLDQKNKKKLDVIKEELIAEIQKIAKSPMTSHEEPTHLMDGIKSIEAEKIWEMIPGQLVQISVGSYQNVWGVAADDFVYRWKSDESEWENISGRLVNVSVGGDGTTWGVNRQDQPHRWDVNRWTYIPAVLKQISVGSKDHVWGISRAGEVWQWEPQSWVKRISTQIGTFDSLSVGSDGIVVLLKENHEVYKLMIDEDEVSFEKIEGKLSNISVGNASEIWGIDTKGQVVKWDGEKETWNPLTSNRKLRFISAGDDGTVWGVDGQGKIFRLNRALLPMSWL